MDRFDGDRGPVGPILLGISLFTMVIVVFMSSRSSRCPHGTTSCTVMGPGNVPDLQASGELCLASAKIMYPKMKNIQPYKGQSYNTTGDADIGRKGCVINSAGEVVYNNLSEDNENAPQYHKWQSIKNCCK